MGQSWARRSAGRGAWASFYFSFILNFSPLSSLLLLNFEPKVYFTNFKERCIKHMHQTKKRFEVQHDATLHSPLGFCLLRYNYISKKIGLPLKKLKRGN